jgi:hypothetical protein
MDLPELVKPYMVVGQEVVVVVGQQVAPIELDWQPLLR